jgi:ATP-binding cassette subfamily C (CFTR/MRP) protein 1
MSEPNSTTFQDGLHLFGPAAPQLFDFAPLFENIFLSIVPSALLLAVIPLRLWTLHNQPRKVFSSLLYGNKLVCSEL